MQQGIVLSPVTFKLKMQTVGDGVYWRVTVLPASFDSNQFIHLVYTTQIYRAILVHIIMDLCGPGCTVLSTLCYVLCDLSWRYKCAMAYEDDDMA